MIDGVEQEEWVEDVDEDKGAVWPIEGMSEAGGGGRSLNISLKREPMD